MKMTPAELVLKDMRTYLAKVKMKPHGPKLAKGVKPTKEQLAYWEEYCRRELDSIEQMIARQELRVKRARERLLEHSEGQSDQAKQDQKLPEDLDLRTKEKRENKVRSLFRHIHHTSS